MIDSESETSYVVVINDEEQYSIWPQHLSVPLGWKTCEMHGSKSACLDYIQEHWL